MLSAAPTMFIEWSWGNGNRNSNCCVTFLNAANADCMIWSPSPKWKTFQPCYLFSKIFQEQDSRNDELLMNTFQQISPLVSIITIIFNRSLWFCDWYFHLLWTQICICKVLDSALQDENISMSKTINLFLCFCDNFRFSCLPFKVMYVVRFPYKGN